MIMTMTYRGYEITRTDSGGWFVVWTAEAGYLKADTLEGMRGMIRDYLAGERFGR